MIVSSSQRLASLNIKLADLKSRLSWGPAFKLFEKLDKASMVEKRKLTIPFIKEYI